MSTATHNDDEGFSSDSDGSVDSKLARYFDKAGDIMVLRGQLDDLELERIGKLTQRELLRDQEADLPNTEEEFEHAYEQRRKSLKEALQAVQVEVESLRLRCVNSGLDIDQVKWRQNHQPGATAAKTSRATAVHYPTTEATLVSSEVMLRESAAIDGDHATLRGLSPSVLRLSKSSTSRPRHDAVSQSSAIPHRLDAVQQTSNPAYPSTDPQTFGSTSQEESPRLANKQITSAHQPNESFDGSRAITDPELHGAYGVVARKKVTGTPGVTEQIDQSYRVRGHPRKFFLQGRVFSILWSEAASASTASVTVITRDTQHSEHTIRRFVVVKAADSYCSAIPIMTYNGHGVAHPGVNKSDHAVIYTGKRPPDVLTSEQPTRGEAPLRRGIRVSPDDQTTSLDSRARLNFGKVYTIEHNVKVKPFGMVHEDSMRDLLYTFRDVWATPGVVPLVTQLPNARQPQEKPPLWLPPESSMRDQMMTAAAQDLQLQEARQLEMLPSGSQAQTSWRWDPNLRRYFLYHAQNDTFIYDDGQQTRRPPSVPRSAVRSNEDFQAYSQSYTQEPTVHGPSPTPELECTDTKRTATGLRSQPRRGTDALLFLDPIKAPNSLAPSLGVSVNTVDNAFAKASILSSQQRANDQQEHQTSDMRQIPAVEQHPHIPANIVQHRSGSTQQYNLQQAQRAQTGSGSISQPTRSPVAPQTAGLNADHLTFPVQSSPVQSPSPQAPAISTNGNRHIHRYAEPVIPRIHHSGDARFVDMQDPSTGVRTRFQDAPLHQITDPVLRQYGVRAQRMLLGTGQEGEQETLFASFRVREQPRKFFTVGKVFLVLWSEPAAENTTVISSFYPADQPGTTIGRYGELVFSKVRHFVVIREGHSYCTALPIAKYGQQGVGKSGVNKSEHGIIYTGKIAPKPIKDELPGRQEDGMRPHAIRVDPDQPDEKLDTFSRIDYGKVTTIQHNTKVKSFGKVNSKSEAILLQQFMNVWAQSAKRPTSSVVASSSRGNQHTAAPATVKGQSSRRSSGGRKFLTALAVASNSSQRESQRVHKQAIPERGGGDKDRHEEDEDENADSGDEDEPLEEGEDEDSDDDGENIRAACRQARRDAITAVVRRGYTPEQAVQILREQIARQRWESRTSKRL